MFDLNEIAREMEDKILNTSGDKIIESPLLTKNQAEKLAYDYLSRYKPILGPINPNFPDISSYVVFAGGRKNA